MTQTEQVIYSMLTENTGAHLLDSGGAYGRNWERNSVKTLEDFQNTPKVKLWDIDHNGFCVSLSLFHHLNSVLTYDEDMQARFDSFVTERNEENAPWLEEMELFVKENNEESNSSNTAENSYNYDNNLSQDIQFVIFEHDDTYYVLLQVHGGCDARGGYTAPKAFLIGDYYDDQFTLQNWNSYGLYCSEGEDHYVDVMGGNIIDNEGSFNDPWKDNDKIPTVEIDGTWAVQCPYCETPSAMIVTPSIDS